MKRKLLALFLLPAAFCLGAYAQQENLITKSEKLDILASLGDKNAERESFRLRYELYDSISEISYFIEEEGRTDLQATLDEFFKKLEERAQKNDPKAIYALAGFYIRQNETEKGEAYAKKAMELNYPDAYSIWFRVEKAKDTEARLKKGLELGSFMCGLRLYWSTSEESEKKTLLEHIEKLAKTTSDKWSLSWTYDRNSDKEKRLEIFEQLAKEGSINVLPMAYQLAKELGKPDAEGWLEEIKKLGEPYAGFLTLSTKYNLHDGQDAGQELQYCKDLYAIGVKRAGYGIAMYYLSPQSMPENKRIYFPGNIKKGVEVRNRDKGVEILEALSKDGSKSASIMLADFYILHDNAPEKAKPIFVSLAEKGNSDVCAKLYLFYKYGINGFEKDEAKAAHYEKLGIESNRQRYVNELGSAYSFYEIEADKKEELRLGRLTLDRNDSAGNRRFYKYRLEDASESERKAFAEEFGILPYHAYCEGVKLLEKKDFAEAVKKFEEAAGQKCLQAVMMLAVCHGEGVGVEKNAELSDKYFAEAEKQMLDADRDDATEAAEILNPASYNGIKRFADIKDFPDSYFRKIIDFALDNNIDGLDYSIMNFFERQNDEDGLHKLYQNKTVSGRFESIIGHAIEFYCSSEKYRDEKKAFELASKFKKEFMEWGDYYAVMIPYMHLNGIGTEKNEAKAFEYLSSKEKPYNDSSAFDALRIYCLKNGIGTEKNPEEADKQRITAVRNALEHTYRIERVADFFIQQHKPQRYKGVFFPKDPDEGVKWLEIAAEEGEPSPLAEAYIDGKGDAVKRDKAKGIAILESKKNKSEDDYRKLVWTILFDSNSADYPKGFKYLSLFIKENREKALRHMSYNDRPQFFQFAYFSMIGKYVEKDEALAYKIFSMYAEESQFAKEMTAYCLQYGIGVEKDEAKAAQIRSAMMEKHKGHDELLFLKFATAYDIDFENPDNSTYPFPKNEELMFFWISKLLENSDSPSEAEAVISEFAFSDNAQLREICVKVVQGIFAKFPESQIIAFTEAVYILKGELKNKGNEGAVRSLQKLADSNYPYALELLSYMHGTGKFVEKDEAKADELFEKFSKSRKKVSIYCELYTRYKNGAYFGTDSARADRLLKIGAEKGDKRSIEEFEKQSK